MRKFRPVPNAPSAERQWRPFSGNLCIFMGYDVPNAPSAERQWRHLVEDEEIPTVAECRTHQAPKGNGDMCSPVPFSHPRPVPNAPSAERQWRRHERGALFAGGRNRAERTKRRKAMETAPPPARWCQLSRAERTKRRKAMETGRVRDMLR